MSTRVWKNPKTPDEYTITLVDVSGNTITRNEEQTKCWRHVATVPGHIGYGFMTHPDLREIIYGKDAIIGLLTEAQEELENIKPSPKVKRFYFSKTVVEKIQNKLEETKSKL